MKFTAKVTKSRCVHRSVPLSLQRSLCNNAMMPQKPHCYSLNMHLTVRSSRYHTSKLRLLLTKRQLTGRLSLSGRLVDIYPDTHVLTRTSTYRNLVGVAFINVLEDSLQQTFKLQRKHFRNMPDMHNYIT